MARGRTVDVLGVAHRAAGGGKLSFDQAPRSASADLTRAPNEAAGVSASLNRDLAAPISK